MSVGMMAVEMVIWWVLSKAALMVAQMVAMMVDKKV
jgi:hypothetical protein